MPSPIPIQNIYYLLIYAWDRLAEGEVVDVTGVDSTELVDLYAAVLANGVRHLMRRGLERSYTPVETELAGIRGRVIFAPTYRRMLPQHGRAYCAFDELTVDTIPNRILRATIRLLIRAPSLDVHLRSQLQSLNRALDVVSEIQLTNQAFRTVQLHGNNAFYGFLLRLCELILQSPILTEDQGALRFKKFAEERLAALYEAFVHNFYKLECPRLEVSRQEIRWVGASANDPKLTYLPRMMTDIIIRRPGQTLVIDTKFYAETLQYHYDVGKIHSANLYQMFAYLKNLEAQGGNDEHASGMLLYPVTKDRLRLSYELGGHNVRICTVDLAQDWKGLRAELLELVA